MEEEIYEEDEDEVASDFEPEENGSEEEEISEEDEDEDVGKVYFMAKGKMLDKDDDDDGGDSDSKASSDPDTDWW